jgi:hypothetical protein
LIGGKGVGEGAGPDLPNSAFDPVLAGERKGDCGGEVAAQTLIARGGDRAMRPRGIEAIPVADEVAGARRHCLRPPDLRRGRFLIQLDQQDADPNAGGEREHPEQDQSRPKRMQIVPALRKPSLLLKQASHRCDVQPADETRTVGFSERRAR